MGYNVKRKINGAYGTLEIDGNEVFEVSEASAVVAITREDVAQSGTNQLGTKIQSTKGTGSFTINKVSSRFGTSFIETLKAEGDPSFTLALKLKDPDNGGSEEYLITECHFDGDFDVINFSITEGVQQSFDFVYQIDNLITIGQISERRN